MSLKLKDFITQLRACKTTKEEKEFILKETANVRQSFQKNEHNYKPRNLVKLLFINLQGFDCDFGQIESLNLACRTTFLEKRVGYLTMASFLHEKSEMLMMATNRIAIDLDHSNPFVREIALSTFTIIADQDMARMLAPKIKSLLLQGGGEGRLGAGYNAPPYASAFRGEDIGMSQLVRKKAFLAVLRVIQKCPDLLLEFLPVLTNVFKEKDHGLFLAAVPLVERFYGLIFEQLGREAQGEAPEDGLEYSKNQLVRKFLAELNENVLSLVDRVKSLLSYGDPDYLVNSVNDPFLLISILQFLKNTLIQADHWDVPIDHGIQKSIQGLVIYVLGNTKQNKKSINAVLYELAQVALVFPENEEMVSAAFAILNQLLEVKEGVPNFKFVGLKLIQTAGNNNERFLGLVGSQCELILEVLKEDDVSLKALALKVLPQISTPENADKLFVAMKEVLVTESARSRPDLEIENAVVNNVFHMLEHKFSDRKTQRLQKSVEFLLVYRKEIADAHLSSLALLIANSEELQGNALPLLWGAFVDNFDSAGLFKVATYVVGECAESLAAVPGLDPASVLLFLDKIKTKVTGGCNKGYFLTCVAKILGKYAGNEDLKRNLSIFRHFLRDQEASVQFRAAEFLAILESSALTAAQKADIFSSIPSNNLKSTGPSVRRPGLPKRTKQVKPVESKPVDDDDFLGLGNVTAPAKPPSTVTASEHRSVIADEELVVGVRFKREGGSYSGSIEVRNPTSQSIEDVVVQLLGISNATVAFKGAKWRELNRGEQKQADFTVNLLNPEVRDARVKVLVKFYPAFVEKLDDFRMSKEGFVTLDAAESVGASAAGGFATNKQPVPPKPSNNDLLDLNFF